MSSVFVRDYLKRCARVRPQILVGTHVHCAPVAASDCSCCRTLIACEDIGIEALFARRTPVRPTQCARPAKPRACLDSVAWSRVPAVSVRGPSAWLRVAVLVLAGPDPETLVLTNLASIARRPGPKWAAAGAHAPLFGATG